MLLSWLHIFALTVYIGCLIGLCLFLSKNFSISIDAKERIKLLYKVLKLYNPIQIGSLGILVLTGAYQITNLKAVHRDMFHQYLGTTLEIKLILAFIIIILSTYQCMGVAHRFVREYEYEDTLKTDGLQSAIKRLRISTVVLLILTLFTIFLETQARY